MRHQWQPSERHGVIGRGLLALLLIAAAFAGLVSVTASHGAAQDDASAFDTRVRFLHADTKEKKVEVHLNGDEVLDEFEYGSLSDWIDIDPGTVRLTITEDRLGFNYAIFDAVYPVPAGNDYLVVITDVLVLASAVDRSPIPDGAARVQIVQASVGLPVVNVVATETDTTLASQLAYSQSSEYVDVSPGSFDVEIQIAETGETGFTESGINIEAGLVYSLVIVGTPGDDDHPLTITPVDDEPLEHAVPPSTPVAAG